MRRSALHSFVIPNTVRSERTNGRYSGRPFDPTHERMATVSDISGPVSPPPPLAANLRKWRERRALSLSALARQAEISKSTVSELERGNGNPSLETLSALARPLNIPLAFLLAEAQGGGQVDIRRLADAPVTSHVEGSYITHLLGGWMGRGEVELSVITLASEGKLVSKGGSSGSVERVVCVEGVVDVSTGSRSDILTPGDIMTFPADQPHFYRAVNGAARLIAVQQYAPTA